VALPLPPTHLVERQKERDRESLYTHSVENDKFGEGEPVKNLGCVLPLLSLNNLTKHEKKEKEREVGILNSLIPKRSTKLSSC